MLSADDRLDILDLVAAASQALDAGDGAALASMFTSDGVFMTGGETFQGWRGLSSLADRQQQVGLTRRHTQTTTIGETAEGWARAVSYVMVTQVRPGPRVFIVGTGTYDDEVARTEDGWRIARRTASGDGTLNAMF